MIKPPFTKHANGDLRESSRVAAPVRVSVDYGSFGEAAYDCRDVSSEGVFLESAFLHELGDRVRLQIDLPGGERIATTGEVVRVELGSPGEGQGMGFAFVELSAADQRSLDGLCAARGGRRRRRRGKQTFRRTGTD